MARAAPIDVQYTNFLKESYHKEENAMLGWYEARKGRPQQPSKQTEVFRKRIEGSLPKPTAYMATLKDLKPKSYHRRVIDPEDISMLIRSAPPLSQQETAGLLSDMRPVPNHVRELLYEGFTKNEKGRYQYLKKRNIPYPEEKFIFPSLSSWDHGWRLSDYIKKEEIKKPTFGRTKKIADTFYTRNGIPTLYRDSTSMF